MVVAKSPSRILGISGYDYHVGGPLAQPKEVVMKKIDVSELQGPLTELLQQFGGERGHERFDEFKLWLKKVATVTLLTFLRTVRIAAQPAVTTSEKYFKEAGVVVMWDNFKAQFLGLEVPATEEAELVVRKLEQDSPDAPILTELGDKAETSVSQFKAFLAANRKSTEWFIFYLRGKDGNLCAVYASWDAGDDGWGVNAGSVDSPGRWRVGNQVLSQV